MNMKPSQTAAMHCKDWRFQLWLDRMRRAKLGVDIPDGTHTEQDARDYLLMACNISSRSELDSNEQARSIFRKIMTAYLRYRIKAWPEGQNHKRGTQP